MRVHWLVDLRVRLWVDMKVHWLAGLRACLWVDLRARGWVGLRVHLLVEQLDRWLAHRKDLLSGH